MAYLGQTTVYAPTQEQVLHQYWSVVFLGVMTPILITPENMLNVSILEYCENESQAYLSIGSPSFVIYAAFKRISRWDIIRCFLIS